MGTNTVIQEAYLCGPIGKAWFKQNDLLYIMAIDEEDEEKVRVNLARSGDIGLLWDACLEVTEVTEQIQTESPQTRLAELLKRECCAHDALTFTLDGLNPEFEEETRRYVIGVADELFEDDEVYHFVQQRLLSRPLTKGMDIQKAIKLSKEGSRMEQLYQNVQALDVAWRAIVPKLEENPQRQEEWLNYLTESKILAKWVVAVLAKDDSKLETMRRDCTREGSPFPKTLELLDQLKRHLMKRHLNPPIKPVVFIDAARDDMEGTKQIQRFLNEKGITYIRPVSTSAGIHPFFKEMKNNSQKCDTVIIPFEKGVPESWLHGHIRQLCHYQSRGCAVSPLQVKIYNTSEEPLKENPQACNLEITLCSSLTECFQEEFFQQAA